VPWPLQRGSCGGDGQPAARRRSRRRKTAAGNLFDVDRGRARWCAGWTRNARIPCRRDSGTTATRRDVGAVRCGPLIGNNRNRHRAAAGLRGIDLLGIAGAARRVRQRFRSLEPLFEPLRQLPRRLAGGLEGWIELLQLPIHVLHLDLPIGRRAAARRGIGLQSLALSGRPGSTEIARARRPCRRRRCAGSTRRRRCR